MGLLKASSFVIALATLSLAGCGNNNPYTAQNAATLLNSPKVSISGVQTAQFGATSFLFADSAGNVGASGNTVSAVFYDTYLPLHLNSPGVFSEQMATGTCASLGTPVTTISGASGNGVSAQISATGCSDQAVINVGLNTTLVADSNGMSGTTALSALLTVDVAPKVATVATGNAKADGSGAAEATAGAFSLAGDQALVVTFSKSVTNGTLKAALSGCNATLGAGAIVPGSNGSVVAWPLTPAAGSVAGGTCTLNVSGVRDSAGNTNDPADPNLSMTVTFH